MTRRPETLDELGVGDEIEMCPACNGAGVSDAVGQVCGTCNGQGGVRDEWVECSWCQSQGCGSCEDAGGWWKIARIRAALEGSEG